MGLYEELHQENERLKTELQHAIDQFMLLLAEVEAIVSPLRDYVSWVRKSLRDNESLDTIGPAVKQSLSAICDYLEGKRPANCNHCQFSNENDLSDKGHIERQPGATYFASICPDSKLIQSLKKVTDG